MRFKIHSGRVIAEKSPDAADKIEPGYAFEEARKRLLDRFKTVADWLGQLPAGACPDDYAVIKVILHPERLAGSNFPRHFLAYFKLSVLGSRKLGVRPQRAFRSPPPGWWDKCLFYLFHRRRPRRSLCLYVAGRKANLAAAAQKFRDIWPDSPAARQMACLETVKPLETAVCLRTTGTSETDSFEVALHLLPEAADDFPLPDFCRYAEEAGFTVHRDHSFKVGSLVFVPVHGPRAKLPRLAQFVFVREIKEAARMRGLTPPASPADGQAPAVPTLPTLGAVSGGPKVAILDAGLPEKHLIGPWLNEYLRSNPDLPDLPGGPEHGLSVASSFLFGPLPAQGPAARPCAPITFHRILDAGSGQEDGLTMYKTLANIRQILAGGAYEFVNISLGPDLPVRDDTILAWTAVLDQIAYEQKIFITLAAGNNGQGDLASGAARVEVPSDCVNAVGVGAADRQGPDWRRAEYSAVGPGRSPALVKPDLLAFGGDTSGSFRTLAPGEALAVAHQCGTSFASPYLLRSAVALKVLGGEALSQVAIKGLLVHYADPAGQAPAEVGWGRAPVIEPDAEIPEKVPLLFQGELAPGTFLRADLEPPEGGYKSAVRIKATFCYCPPVARLDPAAYSRAALNISFVPDMNAPADQDGRPPGLPFFDADGGQLDEDQDPEAVLWANVKSNANDFRGEILKAPCFDIRYVDRSGAGESPPAGSGESKPADSSDSKPVGYCLVVTVTEA